MSSIPSLSDLKKWYASHSKEILSDYFQFLKFPSISTDSKYKDDIHRTANWLCDYLKKIGMKPELWETNGHPVVFATHLKAGPDRPTVLIYQHYDVQPVDPLDLWKTPPFEPQVRDNHVYARGASDNKGQCFYSVTALKAFLELCKEVNVNIKLFIEGEEECGSQGSTEVLSKKKEALKADHLLIVDFGLQRKNSPAISLGYRGITSLNVECRNSSIDLHSGVHGGIALNPNRALATLLAKMWDSEGRVAIPGFYDGIKTLSKQELAKFDQTCEEEYFRKNFGINAFQVEPGSSLWESNAIHPTLEINGMSGGYTGLGFKTVIPAVAIAKISARLVVGQDPAKVGILIANFLKQNLPKGLELKVEFHHGGMPMRISSDTPIAQISAKAYEEVFGEPCKFLLCGATVPIVTDLAAASQAQPALIGVSLAEDDIHAPNEHFGLDQFEQGFLTMGRILGMLSSS